MFGTPTPTSGLGCWSKAKEGQGLGTHQWGALWPAGAQCLLLHAGAQGLGLRVEAGPEGGGGESRAPAAALSRAPRLRPAVEGRRIV